MINQYIKHDIEIMKGLQKEFEDYKKKVAPYVCYCSYEMISRIIIIMEVYFLKENRKYRKRKEKK